MAVGVRRRHYSDVIMCMMLSQITGVSSVCLTRRKSPKTSKLRVTGLCEGNPLVTLGFPSQKASNAENVSVWWRHHEKRNRHKFSTHRNGGSSAIPCAIISYMFTVYLKKYAHGFCFAVLCCGYTLTDFPISIRLTSLALWQSNDCPSASKATLMNMDKYFMWIHYERLHNHNKAKHNETVCIFLGIYCIWHMVFLISALVRIGIA